MFNVSLHAQAVPLRDLNSHAPFHPPSTLATWQGRVEELRTQLKVSQGLWAEPELDPVSPEIYGKLDRDGFSVEKVTFESLPGLMVTGNLYRPAEIEAGQQVPGILCPHGHWREARFHDAGDATVRQLLASGAERFENAARNHIQARCIQLARLGCVGFDWDMIGYCDATQISFERAHRFAEQPQESESTAAGWLLFSPLAEAHCQSVMGLQTLATQRAVDMLLSLPEVDPDRIAITGASGGGTQTFIGAALDERIQVAFPAVMVSTGMQGGCTCENACWLRTGTGNVEIAGLCAPRPLGLTAADDWTKTMPQDGYPELQRLYSLFDADNKVALFPALHFGHNFNHVSRVSLYGWVNRYFELGFETPILERDFELLLAEDLSVWDDQHPQPPGGEEFERQLLKLWANISDAQLTGLLQGDLQQLQQLSETLRDGWRVCLGLTALAQPIEVESIEAPERPGSRVENASVDNSVSDESSSGGTHPSGLHAEEEIVLQVESGSAIPAWSLLFNPQLPDQADNATFGRAAFDTENHQALQEDWLPSWQDLHIEVVAGDDPAIRVYPLLAGTDAAEGSVSKIAHQALVDNPRLAAAYTYGYNPPLLATRAQQLGCSLLWLQRRYPEASLTISANGQETALAAAGVFCSEQIVASGNASSQIDLQLVPGGFSFSQINDIRHPSFLPGSLRFWGLPGLLACLENADVVVKTMDAERFSRLRELFQLDDSRLHLLSP